MTYKDACEELRRVAIKYNVAIITATQVIRPDQAFPEQEDNHDHVVTLDYVDTMRTQK